MLAAQIHGKLKREEEDLEEENYLKFPKLTIISGAGIKQLLNKIVKISLEM